MSFLNVEGIPEEGIFGKEFEPDTFTKRNNYAKIEILSHKKKKQIFLLVQLLC